MAPEQALVLSGELRREHGALGNCLDPRARRHLARTRRALEPALRRLQRLLRLLRLLRLCRLLLRSLARSAARFLRALTPPSRAAPRRWAPRPGLMPALRSVIPASGSGFPAAALRTRSPSPPKPRRRPWPICSSASRCHPASPAPAAPPRASSSSPSALIAVSSAPLPRSLPCTCPAVGSAWEAEPPNPRRGCESAATCPVRPPCTLCGPASGPFSPVSRPRTPVWPAGGAPLPSPPSRPSTAGEAAYLHKQERTRGPAQRTIRSRPAP